MTGSDETRWIPGETVSLADGELVDDAPPEQPARRPGQAGDIAGERYELLECLGRGGMGVVWRARDRQLQREVALKLLEHQSPSMVRRFLREARLQARVDHDNVCKVFDVGGLEGQPYIAMQLLPGRTLNQVAPEMVLEQRALVMAQVAEGVHAAHCLGLIHRDLKPSNIMVEEQAGGTWRATVLDFGLAREVADDSSTVTGSILGTPAFLSPEQARGEELDRRTDVYSLGASLYRIVTGRNPFAGTGMAEALVKVIGEQPPRPRSLLPQIPADLETIMLTAMAKEPRHRYGSAAELAADLRHFVNGEPIVARRWSPAYRLWRLICRHRLVATMVLSALLLVSLLLGMWLAERRTAAQRAELARVFGQQVTRIDGMTRATFAIPPHDIRPHQQWVRQQLDSIRAQMQEVGRAGQGPGHYALGRAYLVLGENQAARDHLEAAWQAGTSGPDVAYALGLSLTRLYLDGLVETKRIADPELREQQRRQLAGELREPALAYLARAEGQTLTQPAYVKGLIAFHEGRHDEAIRQARAAFKQAPWLHEALLLEGEVQMVRGQQLVESGTGYGAAEEAYRQADDAVARACRVGESDPGAAERRCAVAAQLLDLAILRVTPVEPHLAAVQESCDAALALDPGRTKPLELQLTSLAMAAFDRMERLQDPSEMLDRARPLLATALHKGPDNAAIQRAAGSLAYVEARRLESNGGDSRERYDEAIRFVEQALALEPAETRYCSDLAVFLQYRGMSEEQAGGDPRPWFRRAALSLARAIESSPSSYRLQLGLGNTWLYLADTEQRSGADPEASLELAINAIQRATVLQPDSLQGHNNLGLSCWMLARQQASRGHDPSATIDRARAAYRRARELNPSYLQAHLNSCKIEEVAAAAALERGNDPTPMVEQGSREGVTSLQLSPGNHLAAACLVNLATIAAEHLRLTGQDPRDAVRSIVAGDLPVQDTDHFSVFSAEAVAVFCEAHLVAARWELAQAGDPEPWLSQAEPLLRRAIADAPTSVAAQRQLAQLLVLRGRGHTLRGDTNRTATVLAEALSHAEAALEQLPNDVEALTTVASTCLAWLEAGAADPAAMLARGREAAQAALEHNPAAARAMAVLGALEQQAGTGDVTREDGEGERSRRLLEQAIEHNPLLRSDFEQYLRP